MEDATLSALALVSSLALAVIGLDLHHTKRALTAVAFVALMGLFAGLFALASGFAIGVWRLFGLDVAVEWTIREAAGLMALGLAGGTFCRYVLDLLDDVRWKE